MVHQQEYSTIPKVFIIQCIKVNESSEVKSLSYYSDGEEKTSTSFLAALSPVMSLSDIIHDISNKKVDNSNIGTSTCYAN